MTQELHKNALAIQRFLDEKGEGSEVVQLADSTRSAAEAAAALGVDPAQIAKSIVFLTTDEDGRERSVLIVASGRHRIDKKKVKRLLGRKIGRADADAVKRLTGFPIGGVPPIGHLSPPFVLVDETLQEFDVLWAAAGTPFTVFRTHFDQLVRWTGGTVGDVREGER